MPQTDPTNKQLRVLLLTPTQFTTSRNIKQNPNHTAIPYDKAVITEDEYILNKRQWNQHKSCGQTPCTSALLFDTQLCLRALRRVHRGQGDGVQHAVWKQAPQLEHRATLPSCHGKITS